MKQIRDEDFRPEAHEWDGITLVVGDEVQRDMESKLMTAADLKEAIWLAETGGDAFYAEDDGRRVCSMIKPVITYWVEYREVAPGTYEVLSAYYHRMRFRQGE